MTPESHQRRIAYLRKLSSYRKDTGVSGRETDRGFLLRINRLAYGYLLVVGVANCWEIPRSIDRHGSIPAVGYILIATSAFFAAVLIHQLIKNRWVIKVLDLHRVDNLSEIPETPASPADPAS